MYGYIYKTTNIINGKIYIGQKKSQIFLGEKYLGHEVAKLDLGDMMLIKSQTEDGKLCWIVENKFEEYMQNDIKLTHKLVKGEEIMKNKNIKLNAQQPVCIGGRNYTEEEYEREQEEIRKNIIEHFKNSEMDSLSMLADIQYLVLNEMDGLRNKWLWKLYFNKIREDLQSFHGTEQASEEEETMYNNQLLLQEQQNKAMEIIFNKCRDNINLLIVNRSESYDNYNSAFEYQMRAYQMRASLLSLKEEDKLTLDEYIDIYEWLKSERIKHGLEPVVEKEVDVTEGE